MSVAYRQSVDDVTSGMLDGFFSEWPNPPTPETHLRLLQESDHTVVAIDESLGRVIGFATAITDNVLYAAITFLEVLPKHRGRGVGTELVRRILALLDPYYAIDVVCDQALLPFYERLGFRPSAAGTIRRYKLQAGRPVR